MGLPLKGQGGGELTGAKDGDILYLVSENVEKRGDVPLNGKLPYEKPELELVDFTLTSSVANSCSFGSAGDDGWNFDPGNFFCYHIPTEDYNIYSS